MTDLLATVEDYAATYGTLVDHTDLKVIRALEDASALFRSLAKQTITLVEDDTVELEGSWNRRLYLPERPVLAVSNVSIDSDACGASDVAADDYRVSRRGVVKMRGLGSSWGGEDASVTLTYSHGYAEVPADVVAVVVSWAGRIKSNPVGVLSERIGEHQVDWASQRADGSTIGLSAEQQDVVRKYRPFR